MGTSISVHANGEHGVAAVRKLFDRLEKTFSRFDADSELSRINGSRAEVVASFEMAQILADARRLHAATDGLVDIGVGRRVSDWGYGATFNDVRDLAGEPDLSEPWLWSLEGRTVTLSAETRLDLGGIAKGWTSDLAVSGGLATVVSAGGDIRSSDPSLEVDLLDGDDAPFASVHVGIGALATSSRLRRRWQVGANDAHHIIDPRTGSPALTPILSATVLADTAVDAEAGAKAVLILGEDGLSWASQQSWIESAIVLWHDGSVYATSEVRAA